MPTVEVPCPYCNGEKVIDEKGNPPSSGTFCGTRFYCPDCNGTGKVTEEISDDGEKNDKRTV